MWRGNREFCGSGGTILLSVISLVVIILAVLCQAQIDGSPKDITIVRPKHLKYPSYRSLQRNESYAEEAESRRHNSNNNNGKRPRSSETLDAEESRQQSHQIDDQDAKVGRKFTNSTTGTSATNLKRSLLPGLGGGGGDLFGGDSKGARFGSPLGIQKTPPDLQFGLAFTVPFVSLSTDKLINTFSGKSYGGGGGGQNDVSNILKLNLGGLIAAIVVGIGAFFLVPGLLHPGKFGGGGGNGFGGGWGSSLLDSILPHGIPGILDQFLGGHFGHGGNNFGPDNGDGWSGNEDHVGNRPFGYQDFYEYNGVHNHNRKDTTAREKSSRREGRSNDKVNGTAISVAPSELFGNLVSTVSNYAKKYVTTAQSCLQLQICRKAVSSKKEKKEKKIGEDEDEIDLLGLVESLSDNELVRDSPVSMEIKKAHEHGQTTGECQKYERPECK
ncbi:uncharacterized protein LOC118436116 [Folsomia candida]|uniref:uncharacterized protein LOC118436116 n=1 Tax=Folsomia candida TaxID=158441 RepID=UPI0016050430|nr:uncharacterized protein LOC118436116 [Folsomia candida]